MAFYTTFLNIGVALGIIIDGAIDLTGNWRWMYWTTVIILGVMMVLITFTFPGEAELSLSLSVLVEADPRSTPTSETSFNRSIPDKNHMYNTHGHGRQHEHGTGRPPMPEKTDSEVKDGSGTPAEEDVEALPPVKTYWQSMAFYNGVFTTESLWKMFYRPFLMIFLPAGALFPARPTNPPASDELCPCSRLRFPRLQCHDWFPRRDHHELCGCSG
jgi:MFS family permease